MKYRKKPVVIEAWKIADLLAAAKNDWKALPKQVADAYDRGQVLFLNGRLDVQTLEGWIGGYSDDMLICGVKGELYPCKPDIFEATYDVVLP